MQKMRTSKLLMGCVAVALAGCEQPAPPEVSFAGDVFPLLERHCLECHQRQAGQSGFESSGFSMENYEALMKGTRYGPMVVPGDSLSSVLTTLIEGRADPSISMPHGDRPPLKQHEIDTIKAWVDQGAKNN